MERPLKVLQLLGGGKSIGGVEKMLLNYYSRIDRSKVIFDFCFYRENTFGTVYDEFRDVLDKSKIFELKTFKQESGMFGYLRTIPKVKRLIKDNGYEIVHINAGRPPLLISGLIAAKLAGARVRMVHSHSTKGRDGRGLIGSTAYNFASSCIKPILRNLSTHLFGCSTEAGKYMFGNKAVLTPKYTLIHNAINVEPYRYNQEIRLNLRKENGVDDQTLLFGHVGRFSEEKNHMFLIEVFSHIHKQLPDSRLWIIGDGDENIKTEVLKKISSLSLTDHVTLLGSRKDVNCIDQALDAMIFPSTYEGLSVVLVEAQAAALPVYTSTNISPEHRVSDVVSFLDLKEGAKTWADYIVKDMPKHVNRKDTVEQVRKNGYDIETEAQALQQLYLDSIK